MSFLNRPAFLLAAAIALLIAIVACASGSSETYEAPEIPEDFDASICEPVLETMTIAKHLEFLATEDIGIRALRQVRSPNMDDVWFLAADVEGPGYEGPGPIQVWWALDVSRSYDYGYLEEPDQYSDFPWIGTLTSLNDTATRLTQFDGRVPFDLGPPEEFPEGTEGEDLVEYCVLQALEENPGEQTASEFFAPGQWFTWHFAGFDAASILVEVSEEHRNCLVLHMIKLDDSPNYAVLGWPDRTYDTASDLPTRDCERSLRNEKINPVPVEIESVPWQYRHIVDPSLPPQPSPTPAPPTPTPTIPESEYGVCFDLGDQFSQEMADLLRSDDLGLRAFKAVRRDDSFNEWAIVADLEGEGFEGEGPVLRFHSYGLDINSLSFTAALDRIGEEYLHILELPVIVDENGNDRLRQGIEPAYELAVSCVHQALAEDPDTTVYTRQ